MSDLVGNPEDQFSRVTAHLSHIMRKTDYCKCSHGLLSVIVHHFQIYVLAQFDKEKKTVTWKSKLMLGINANLIAVCLNCHCEVSEEFRG